MNEGAVECFTTVRQTARSYHDEERIARHSVIEVHAEEVGPEGQENYKSKPLFVRYFF